MAFDVTRWLRLELGNCYGVTIQEMVADYKARCRRALEEATDDQLRELLTHRFMAPIRLRLVHEEASRRGW